MFQPRDSEFFINTLGDSEEKLDVFGGMGVSLAFIYLLDLILCSVLQWIGSWGRRGWKYPREHNPAGFCTLGESVSILWREGGGINLAYLWKYSEHMENKMEAASASDLLLN